MLGSPLRVMLFPSGCTWSPSGGGNSRDSTPKMRLRVKPALGELLSTHSTVCAGQQSYCRHLALPRFAGGAVGRVGRAGSAGSARDGQCTQSRSPGTQPCVSLCVRDQEHPRGFLSLKGAPPCPAACSHPGLLLQQWKSPPWPGMLLLPVADGHLLSLV